MAGTQAEAARTGILLEAQPGRLGMASTVAPCGRSGLRDALNAKGNFRFERQIVEWRDRPLVDLRLKR